MYEPYIYFIQIPQTVGLCCIRLFSSLIALHFLWYSCPYHFVWEWIHLVKLLLKDVIATCALGSVWKVWIIGEHGIAEGEVWRVTISDWGRGGVGEMWEGVVQFLIHTSDLWLFSLKTLARFVLAWFNFALEKHFSFAIRFGLIFSVLHCRAHQGLDHSVSRLIWNWRVTNQWP